MRRESVGEKWKATRNEWRSPLGSNPYDTGAFKPATRRSRADWQRVREIGGALLLRVLIVLMG